MKTLVCSLLVLLASSVGATDSTRTWQQWKKTWAVYKPNDSYLYLQTNNLIRSIQVLDMRSDTSLLGLFTNSAQKPHAIQSGVGLERLLQQKLANNTTGLSLLLVIKHFWINEANTTIVDDKRMMPGFGYDITPNRRVRTQAVSFTKMKCVVDVFVKREDAYCTLVRIDTVLTAPKRLSSTTELMINMSINAISNKVTGSLQVEYYKTRKPVAIETIINSYSSIFDVPILKSPELKKGIYFTWDQFKNNQSQNLDFTIRTNDKEPPTLYLKEDGEKEIFSRDVYALCDGKKLFRVRDGYVFEMFCDGRSTYWMGIERQDLKNKSIPLILPGPGMFAFGSESISTKMRVLLTPYLMNPETGLQY